VPDQGELERSLALVVGEQLENLGVATFDGGFGDRLRRTGLRKR
jgi:hypothetical protein